MLTTKNHARSNIRKCAYYNSRAHRFHQIRSSSIAWALPCNLGHSNQSTTYVVVETIVIEIVVLEVPGGTAGQGKAELKIDRQCHVNDDITTG